MHGRNLAVGSHNDRHVPDRRCPGALRAPASWSIRTVRWAGSVASDRSCWCRSGTSSARSSPDWSAWPPPCRCRSCWVAVSTRSPTATPHAVRRRPVRARHHPVRLRLHLPVWALPLGAAHREGSPQPDVRAAHRALVRFLGPHPIRPGHQPGQHRHPIDPAALCVRPARRHAGRAVLLRSGRDAHRRHHLDPRRHCAPAVRLCHRRPVTEPRVPVAVGGHGAPGRDGHDRRREHPGHPSGQGVQSGIRPGPEPRSGHPSPPLGRHRRRRHPRPPRTGHGITASSRPRTRAALRRPADHRR